ncbi:MAG: shikimate kinase [Waddliaceae bacterium]
MNIILCGPPCVGKSTVAKLTAARLGWDVIDTDLRIEEEYERETGEVKSYGEIYKIKGDNNFRVLEKQALLRLNNIEKGVIALGGGVKEIPLRGVVIFLRASFETLWQRLLMRPQLPAYLPKKDARKRFETHVLDRLSACEAMADITLDTDNLSPEKIVDRICTVKEERTYGIQ